MQKKDKLLYLENLKWKNKNIDINCQKEKNYKFVKILN